MMMFAADAGIKLLVVHGVLPGLLLIAALFESDSSTRQQQDKQQTTPTRRARRPTFESEDWQSIFFDNVFDEGLVGPRPELPPVAAESPPTGKAQPDRETSAKASWSRYISRETLEDEVKSLNRKLQTSVTTASRFNTQYGAVREHFNMLSMLFAIIDQYDQDIRWKDHALSAQTLFADAAAKTRSPSKPAFEIAKAGKLALEDLVRGGRLNTNQRPPEKLDWSNVADRRALMVRLEEALQEHLKPSLARLEESGRAMDELRSQAEIVSAMGEVLLQPGMDEAEEDSYREFAVAMRDSAQAIGEAVKTGNGSAVAQNVNAVTQSCNDCHGEWR